MVYAEKDVVPLRLNIALEHFHLLFKANTVRFVSELCKFYKLLSYDGGFPFNLEL